MFDVSELYRRIKAILRVTIFLQTHSSYAVFCVSVLMVNIYKKICPSQKLLQNQHITLGCAKWMAKSSKRPSSSSTKEPTCWFHLPNTSVKRGTIFLLATSTQGKNQKIYVINLLKQSFLSQIHTLKCRKMKTRNFYYC